MKKLLFALVALVFTFSATAQTAEEIVKKFADKTGVEKFMQSRDGNSSVTELEISVGPATILSKVTSKFPSLHRVELDVQGQTALVIIRDTTAYMSAQGKVQTITGADQIRQMVPVVDLVKEIVPEIDLQKVTLTLVGQEGKGKNAVNVIEVEEKDSTLNGKTKMYFNAETGLLDRTVTQVKGQDDKMVEIEVTFKKYAKFADDEMLLPTSITTKLPGQSITINVQKFELDFPTASWMFAAPKM